MSYNIDGKVVNQSPRKKVDQRVTCGKCCKLIYRPDYATLTTANKETLLCFHYIGTPFFIYETKSGSAVVYCSEYCRNKHNHRFKK